MKKIKKMTVFASAMCLCLAMATGCGNSKSSSATEKTDDIENALDVLAETINDKDIESFLNVSLPNKTADGFTLFLEHETQQEGVDLDFVEEGFFKVMGEELGFGDDIDFTGYDVANESPEYTDEYILRVSAFINLAETDDLENFNWDSLEDNDSVKPAFSMEKPILIKAHTSGGDDVPILVYDVNGEGMKADLFLYPSVAGFEKRQQQRQQLKYN